MSFSRRRWLFLTALAGVLGWDRALPASDAEGLEFFEKRIRPLLSEQCYECHSEQSKKVKGGLLLDSRDGVLQGGDSGPAIVPGDPDKSRLVVAARHADKELRMPPKRKLSDGQIADLEAWVKMGAPDPRKDPATLAAGQKPRIKYGMSIEEGRKFWALKPVQDPPVPKVATASWPRTPVDNFILSRLDQAGVSPAPAADKRTLLRRATFDLTGLPPTPSEMDAFLADNSPAAFEKVVDRLLASPRYGERWGRHWLDVARYSDTCGNASDYPVPQAHRYRDWVIAAFNRDMPYDRFLREQISGDLIPGGSDTERYERIVATGYLAIARRFGGSRRGDEYLTIEDTIDNLGRTVLGFSLSCARCHDHKFDPFTTSDYYGLYGIFDSTRYPFPGAEASRKQEDFVPLMSPAEIEALLKPHRETITAQEAEVKRLEAAKAEAIQAPDEPPKTAAPDPLAEIETGRDTIGADGRPRLLAALKVEPAKPVALQDKKARVEAATKAVADAKKKLTELQAQTPAIRDAYAVSDGKPANAKIQLRGDPKRLGDEVPRHFPAVLGGQEIPKGSSASGRLELAQWITDPANPLTARVMVNRIWQQHFGKAIVQTPNDFGRQGRVPTHPELLDYLAARFVASGWSIKAMHRLIMLSQTWQLASADVPESAKLDPNNDLFWKFNRHRLDAESIRDALLFVCGDLDETPAGPHPFPPSASWGYTQHNPFVANYETRQRSIYLMQQRLRKNPYLALFDGADPSSSTGVRLPSTTPLQALFAMNDPLVHTEAAKFSALVLAGASDETARLALACRLAFNRPPDADEQQECANFLRGYRDKLAALTTPPNEVEPKAWTALARVLLGSNEFVFVD